MNRETLHYLETFEGWLLIIFSDISSYRFQAFSPVGEKMGDLRFAAALRYRGSFNSVAAAVQQGRKFITGAKL
ncbi:hypothetical protein H6F77_24195 [Microcoleus sp. FACHB-831]|uniref:hypothetical protein n=1 Tax=Microcoleus sp. FACHB-831 TaxID=2692827 RepID=UPI0016840B64|nr:hypothetical protein [Microcoleus sp. FACHB-831]MBD1924147.1 hypothetical protein [Microcoleus sp. FACHB-831]